jgi:hypothetical protein
MPKDKHCCPGVIPTPTAGWQIRLLDDCCTVEYIFKLPWGAEASRWIWSMKDRKWTPPIDHPDPNPWTPEGVPLAGPGTL